MLISDLPKPREYVAHPRPVATVTERLSDHTEVDGCWLWNGRTTTGYGRMKLRGRDEYVHRVSYVQHVGLIPDGMGVGQLCGHRRCLNPAHLFLTRKRKLTVAEVIEIRRRYVADPTATHESLAVEFGVAQVTVNRVLRPHLGSSYSSVPDLDGYVWRPLKA